MIWQSEALVFATMFLSLLAGTLLFVWAWRRGHLSDLEETAGIVVEVESEGKEPHQ